MKAVFPVSMVSGGGIVSPSLDSYTNELRIAVDHDTPFDRVIKIRDKAVAQP